MLRHLLHALLVLTLALNGVGNGFAMTDAAHMEPNAGHAADIVDIVMDAPCGSHGEAAAAVADDTSGDKHMAGGDCCDGGGACDCACLHAMQAITMPARGVVADPGHALFADALGPGHPSPPRSEDIRPPIA